MHAQKDTKDTKTDRAMRLLKNNKMVATLIVVVTIIIGFDKLSGSIDNILRTLGIKRTYVVDQDSDRGKFSSNLLENAWNRMFWMRVYAERVKVGATKEEQLAAWQKYVDATEKWSSNIMNYYLGLEQYYPNSGKRDLLEDTIQPQFINIATEIRQLRFNKVPILDSEALKKIDTIQWNIDSVNNDFYFLIDQPMKKN